MNPETKGSQSYQFAHILILTSYTILSAALIGEALLLDWEKWPLLLILVCIIICWLLHLRRSMNDLQRLWAYTLMMMGTFFYYGIHITSTYDMALLTLIMIIIYTTSGERRLVWAAVFTYYITLIVNISRMISSGAKWDELTITRTILHICIVFMSGLMGQLIIRQWAIIFHQSDEQLASLNAATRRMNFFMANLSHELRTPINVVLGITGVMKDRESGGHYCEGMDAVIAAGQRMDAQTDDILDFSELETETLVVNSAPCMLSSVLNDLIHVLQPVLSPKLELVIDVSPEVPAFLITDADKLKKILYHLIRNSLSFTREGGVYAGISCIRQSYGINLLLEVTDTGIGMTKEDQENAFRQFFQAESGRDMRSGGLGIGLSIVSGFVHALGGFLTIKSEVGEGTTMRVSLPQALEDERSCIELDSPDHYYLGAYLNFLKYTNPHVREYYNSTIKNIVRGLDTPLHRVDNPEDLKKLADTLPLTHLFTGEEEYTASRELLETLARNTVVAVIAGSDFSLPRDSRAVLIQKPLTCFRVLSVLRLKPGENRILQERMLCPGISALVVDDEPMNLHVAVSILQSYGMIVTTATSGKEAVALCSGRSFDIIFMDHMMPEMDGLEAMRQIRFETGGSSSSHIPLVMLTANTLSSARDMFYTAGADGYIGKPIELPELERVLKRVLPSSAIRYETITEKPQQQKDTDAPKAFSLKNTFEALTARGVNVKEGLRYCQNDEAFYLELLSQFVFEAPAKKESLTQSYASRDHSAYTITAHSLKSTSKMIGANSFSETARLLEKAAKGGDQETIDALHGRLLSEYAALTDGIASLLGSGLGAGRKIQREVPEETASPRTDKDEDIMEFAPHEETAAPRADKGEDIMEFAPHEETAAPRAEKGDDIMEFAPHEETAAPRAEKGEDIMEFAPHEETAAPRAEKDDDILEFSPVEEEDVR